MRIHAMKFSPRDITQIALFSALTAVGAFIRIPLPYIPFTLQTFFVSLSGALLGSKKGMLSQLLYLTAGLLGAPIFTRGGGLGYVLQPTFGYLIGFVFSAWITGRLVERLSEMKITRVYPCVASGLSATYFCGVIYLYLMTNIYIKNAMPIGQALYYGFVLVIGGDLLSLYPASVLVVKLTPILRRMGLVERP